MAKNCISAAQAKILCEHDCFQESLCVSKAVTDKLVAILGRLPALVVIIAHVEDIGYSSGAEHFCELEAGIFLSRMK